MNIILLIIGFILLIKGADWFVDGASGIADKLGIPKIVIGLTIVAFGTSAPEAAVSISAALKGSTDLAVSNVLGSNILNVLIILGIASCIFPLPVQTQTTKLDVPLTMCVSALLLILGYFDGYISRIDGAIFVLGIIVYCIYMIRASLNKTTDEAHDGDEKEPVNIWKSICFCAIGIVMIVIGSDCTVNGATEIAKMLGMSERLIGLTVVAFGTSLPELVTSCIAAKKHETDIAVGNVVGSNLFNIMFVLGATAVINPIAYSGAYIIDNIIAIGVMLLLFLFIVFDKKINRHEGIIMVGLYAAYFAYII